MNDREWEERSYEEGARLGDPRRCPVHNLPTSSPDGMHDAPCPACEVESDQQTPEDALDDAERSYGPQAPFFRDQEKD